MTYRLDWKGAETRAQIVAAVVSGMTEFGLRHETESKRQLQPGRGVLTGTLRRSIHAAAPTYNFSADDVAPSNSSPERGGSGGGAIEEQGKVAVAVGSGMIYARAIEELYGYLTAGHQTVKPEILAILNKHAAQAGLL